MPNFDLLIENLTAEGFAVSHFPTAAAAADYLDAQIDGKTIGTGGSMTLEELGILPRLAAHNTLLAHDNGEADRAMLSAEIFLSSVNGVAETGELVNIDGIGNRLAGGLFGHKKVYFVVGSNKIMPDYDAALFRARNVAGPKNAQRLHRRTPCAEKADRCYNCKSAARICRALVVYWEKPKGMQYEIVLVDEVLGL